MNTYFNQCELSPWYLASVEYNDDPKPIRILGVRRENHLLFKKLMDLESHHRRSEVFNEYMSVKFQLHDWRQYGASAADCLKNSYLKFIRNWGIDSNSPSGAVLKSWVESRIGIEPTFHRKSLSEGCWDARYQFRNDIIQGSARTSAINLQLDLLFEFCQFELEMKYRNCKWLTLYRGTHDPEEYQVVETNGNKSCVLLNNLSSFTSDKERAWEFGSTVWEVKVPIYKVLFYSGLLPNNLLDGENEYLIIGGHYWVKPLLY